MLNWNTFRFPFQASILSIPDPGPEIQKVNKAIKRVRFIISDEDDQQLNSILRLKCLSLLRMT